MNRRRSVV